MLIRTSICISTRELNAKVKEVTDAAFLESELGNYKEALAKAAELKQIINNDQAPAVYYTFAQLYLDMDSLDLAKINIEKAIALDPKHQMAFRVKAKVDTKLTEQHVDSIN